MATLTPGEIVDLVNLTLKDLGRDRITNLMNGLNEYHAMPRLLRDGVSYDSGTALQWQVALTNTGAAKMTGLYNVDTPNVDDVTANCSLDWKFMNTSYAFDRRELAMNGDPARIFELLQIRRADAYASAADLLEAQFFGAPGSGDVLSLNGINYWQPARTDVSAGTFLPLGYPSNTVAGLDVSAAANARWRHWAATYGSYTTTESANGLDDSITKRMRIAMRRTDFMPPVSVPEYRTADNYLIATTLKVMQALEDIAEAQNDSLGRDVASMDGKVLFRSMPITWCPQIDSTVGGAGFLDTSGSAVTDPILGINLGVIKPVFLRGEFMREEAAESASNQHNVFHVQIDSTLNIKCVNRRRLWTLHYETA